MAATLSAEMIKLIRDLADNRISQAKADAIAVCNLDESKKNAREIGRLKHILENRNESFLEVPFNLKGLLEMKKLSENSYKPNRYYLNKEREDLYQMILNSVNVSEKLAELGIPYLNSTLLSGEPGTGKTEFAKAVAYRLNVPFAYINFSGLIDPLLGKTSQNLQAAFDYVKGERCLLLLDEIDCIGLRRGSRSGVDGELARTTITLMQCLDNLIDGQIVIGATNRADRLDDALLRRFQRRAEFVSYNSEDNRKMILQYLDDIGLKYDLSTVDTYINKDKTQAAIIKHLNEAIVLAVSTDSIVKL